MADDKQKRSSQKDRKSKTRSTSTKKASKKSVALTAQHMGCGGQCSSNNCNPCGPNIDYHYIRRLLTQLPGTYALDNVQGAASRSFGTYRGLAAVTRNYMNFTVTDGADDGFNPVGSPDIWSFFAQYSFPSSGGLCSQHLGDHYNDPLDGNWGHSWNHHDNFSEDQGLLQWIFREITFIRYNSSLQNPTLFREISSVRARVALRNQRLYVRPPSNFPISCLIIALDRIAVTTRDGTCYSWLRAVPR